MPGIRPLPTARSGAPAGTRTGVAPGPTGFGVAEQAGVAELKALAPALYGLACDLAGIADASTADGTAALTEFTQGQWLENLLRGKSLFPYIGDLYATGRLPTHLKAVEDAVELGNRFPACTVRLLPGMQRLAQALDALPRGVDPTIDRMSELVRDFERRQRVARRLHRTLLDVSPQFRFFLKPEGEFILDVATGRLGIPTRVQQHRSGYQQSLVAGGTGDDAGHRIGNRFGAPGDARNLARQNWVQNRFGTWRKLEDAWAEMLERGIGIVVTVTDVFRRDEPRPSRREVEWTEIYPNGQRVTRYQSENVVYGNFETARSRSAAGLVPEFKSAGDNIIDLAQWKRRLGGTS